MNGSLDKEYPSGVVAGLKFPCGVDVCSTGIQFCMEAGYKTCTYCSDYFHDCFTNLQQQNCTQYCMDQWIQNQPNATMGIPEDHIVTVCHIEVFLVLFLLTASLWILREIFLTRIIRMSKVRACVDTLKRVCGFKRDKTRENTDDNTNTDDPIVLPISNDSRRASNDSMHIHIEVGIRGNKPTTGAEHPGPLARQSSQKTVPKTKPCGSSTNRKQFFRSRSVEDRPLIEPTNERGRLDEPTNHRGRATYLRPELSGELNGVLKDYEDPPTENSTELSPLDLPNLVLYVFYERDGHGTYVDDDAYRTTERYGQQNYSHRDKHEQSRFRCARDTRQRYYSDKRWSSYSNDWNEDVDT